MKRWWTPLGPYSPRSTAETNYAASESTTSESDDSETRLIERTSLLAEPRVRGLLFLYGLYMVRRLLGVGRLEMINVCLDVPLVDKGPNSWFAN